VSVTANSTITCVYEITPSQLQTRSAVILGHTSSVKGVPDDLPLTDSMANDFGVSIKRPRSSAGAWGGNKIDDAHANTVHRLDCEASGHWDG